MIQPCTHTHTHTHTHVHASTFIRTHIHTVRCASHDHCAPTQKSNEEGKIRKSFTTSSLCTRRSGMHVWLTQPPLTHTHTQRVHMQHTSTHFNTPSLKQSHHNKKTNTTAPKEEEHQQQQQQQQQRKTHFIILDFLAS